MTSPFPVSLHIVHRLSMDRSRGSLTDYLSDGGSGRCLRVNVAHLLALTVDSIIALVGGLRPLLSQSTNPLQPGTKKVQKKVPNFF